MTRSVSTLPSPPLPLLKKIKIETVPWTRDNIRTPPRPGTGYPKHKKPWITSGAKVTSVVSCETKQARSGLTLFAQQISRHLLGCSELTFSYEYHNSISASPSNALPFSSMLFCQYAGNHVDFKGNVRRKHGLCGNRVLSIGFAQTTQGRLLARNSIGKKNSDWSLLVLPSKRARFC